MRDLHDHPWESLSFLLFGALSEEDKNGVRKCGFFRYRKAEFQHRLVLPAGHTVAWTLFMTGPKRRTWGFQAPSGWIPWYDYTGSR